MHRITAFSFTIKIEDFNNYLSLNNILPEDVTTEIVEDYLNNRGILVNFEDGDIVYLYKNLDELSWDQRKEISDHEIYVINHNKLFGPYDPKDKYFVLPKDLKVPRKYILNYWSDVINNENLVLNYDLNNLKLDFVENIKYGDKRYVVYKDSKNDTYIVIKEEYENDVTNLNKFLQDGKVLSV